MLAHISAHAFFCLCYLLLNLDMKILGGFVKINAYAWFVPMLTIYKCTIFGVPTAHYTSVDTKHSKNYLTVSTLHMHILMHACMCVCVCVCVCVRIALGRNSVLGSEGKECGASHA